MSVLPVGFGSSAGGGTPANAIERSLRFNSADTAYLNRTGGTSTSRRIHTFSFWTKYVVSGGTRTIASAGSDDNNREAIFIDSNVFDYQVKISSTFYEVITTQVFRDPSAWYHFVVAVDTTQATGSNRVKIYVNGTQITAFSSASYPPQNSDLFFDDSNGGTSYIGALRGFVNSTFAYNGYITEFNFIDGQALTPSSFGQINASTGVWEPIPYTGTYGTNGFYVNFSDNSNTTAATLGKDSSGNGNNWTPNNFSVTAGAGNDSLVDSPTAYGTDTGVGGSVRGNYCTLNPLKNEMTLSNGNLAISGGLDTTTTATMAVPSTGKWYFEFVPTSMPASNANIGLASSSFDITNATFTYAEHRVYIQSGNKADGSGSVAYGASWTTSDVIGVAVDMDAGTLVFYKNNTSQGTAFSDLVSSGKTWFPLAANYGSGTFEGNFNFGQRAFSYTAPSGFKALCTTNLPTPTIGATSTTQANKYFAINTYAGTGATNAQTVGFAPDFVWIKARTNAYWHKLFDTIRGANKPLVSNDTGAELTETQGLMSFDSNGFTLGTSSDSTVNNAGSGQTYVAWNWKANGAGSTNSNGTAKSSSVTVDSGTDTVTWNSHGMSDGQKIGFFATTMPGGLNAGTLYYVRDAATNTFKVAASSGGAAIDITSNGTTVTAHTTLTSTVSANTAAGFSIVKHINSGAPATIEHGLGVAPKFIINKVYDRTENWRVYYGISNKILILNLSSAEATDTNIWNNTNPTSNVFSIGTYFSSGDDVISYCFAPVAGYSAFGSYTGNGSSTDGVFIYLGFRPRYVLIKRTNTTENWHVMDTSRNSYNAMDASLYPNLANSEVPTSGHAIDFLSNGIKMRNSNTGYNASGSTYIYAAFAESPFKYSLGR